MAETPKAAPQSLRNSPPAMKTLLPFTVASVRAISDELVTTVSLRCCSNSRARKLVVVPVSSMMDSPSRIVARPTMAIMRLAWRFRACGARKAPRRRCCGRPMAPCILSDRSLIGQRLHVAPDRFQRYAKLVAPGWRWRWFPRPAGAFMISPCRLENSCPKPWPSKLSARLLHDALLCHQSHKSPQRRDTR